MCFEIIIIICNLNVKPSCTLIFRSVIYEESYFFFCLFTRKFYDAKILYLKWILKFNNVREQTPFRLLSFKHFAEQCKNVYGVKNLAYVISIHEIYLIMICTL